MLRHFDVYKTQSISVATIGYSASYYILAHSLTLQPQLRSLEIMCGNCGGDHGPPPTPAMPETSSALNIGIAPASTGLSSFFAQPAAGLPLTLDGYTIETTDSEDNVSGVQSRNSQTS